MQSFCSEGLRISFLIKTNQLIAKDRIDFVIFCANTQRCLCCLFCHRNNVTFWMMMMTTLGNLLLFINGILQKNSDTGK